MGTRTQAKPNIIYASKQMKMGWEKGNLFRSRTNISGFARVRPRALPACFYCTQVRPDSPISPGCVLFARVRPLTGPRRTHSKWANSGIFAEHIKWYEQDRKGLLLYVHQQVYLALPGFSPCPLVSVAHRLARVYPVILGSSSSPAGFACSKTGGLHPLIHTMISIQHTWYKVTENDAHL